MFKIPLLLYNPSSARASKGVLHIQPLLVRLYARYLSSELARLYTKYPIVALGLPAIQPLGRVRRASKGNLHKSRARTRPKGHYRVSYIQVIGESSFGHMT